MAKKKAVKEIKPGDPLPGPDPQPKVGDQVKYLYHENAGSIYQGKSYDATVKVVHDDPDGRLVNLEVELSDGPQRIGPVTYRDYDKDAPCGNTWHWPDDETATAEA